MDVKKRKNFGPDMVLDLYDNLTSHNWALRAFGALLEGADLENRFGNSSPDGMDYRCGLNQIVELYIEHQERKLDEIRFKCFESPEHVLKSALDTYEMIQQGGCRTNEIALEQCRKAITQIAMVITEFGEEQCPDAVQAREKLLKLQSVIAGNMSAAGAERSKPVPARKGKLVAVEWPNSRHGAGKSASA